MSIPFVIFEGVDGVGKSTHVNHLTNSLTEKGYSVLSFSQPYTSNSSIKKIIDAIPDCDNPLPEMLLHIASMVILQDDILKIISAKDYDIIISDRSFISTLVYQLLIDFDPSLYSQFLNLLQPLLNPIPTSVFILSNPNHLDNLSNRSKDVSTLDKYESNTSFLKQVSKLYDSNHIENLFKNISNQYNIKQPNIFRLCTNNNFSNVANNILDTILLHDL